MEASGIASFDPLQQQGRTGERSEGLARYHLSPDIVVIREIQPDGLVLVENETPGRRLP